MNLSITLTNLLLDFIQYSSYNRKENQFMSSHFIQINHQFELIIILAQAWELLPNFSNTCAVSWQVFLFDGQRLTFFFIFRICFHIFVVLKVLVANDLLANEISQVTDLTFFEIDIGFFFRFCSVITANHRLSQDLC